MIICPRTLLRDGRQGHPHLLNPWTKLLPALARGALGRKQGCRALLK